MCPESHVFARYIPRRPPMLSDSGAGAPAILISMRDPHFTTCVHEAGHSVVAILAGLGVQYASVIPSDDAAGKMYWSSSRGPVYVPVENVVSSDATARLLVYVAGTAAVRALTGTAADLAGRDQECADEYARELRPHNVSRTVEQALRDAEALFRSVEAVRNVTLGIAYQLRRDRIVLGADVEHLLRGTGVATSTRPPTAAPPPAPTAWMFRHVAERGPVLGSSAFLDSMHSLDVITD